MDFCDDCGELIEDISQVCVCQKDKQTADPKTAQGRHEESSEPTETTDSELEHIKAEWEKYLYFDKCLN